MTYIELFSYFRSTATWRVRIALNLKQVPHELNLIWVRDDAYETPEYLALNSHGLVPAMRIGETVIGQ
jgi:glutathione S-transferase